jgi:hypothetical protein
MERDWLPPVRVEPDEVDTLKLNQIEVKSYVGGLVKSFERKAAKNGVGAAISRRMLQTISPACAVQSSRAQFSPDVQTSMAPFSTPKSRPMDTTGFFEWRWR